MRIRKLLDWRKLLIYSHRWMGIAFGLLFVSWFISGVAFMYWGMPALSQKERLDHQLPVDLSTAAVAPAEAFRGAFVTPASLRIVMNGDRPVYIAGGASVYADTGAPVPVRRASANEAVRIVRDWVPEHAATVRHDARLLDSDQWTLQGAQRSQMPLHRVAVGDPADTYYYVAENTGEIVMKTDRWTRFKGFWSGVLHWVYFTQLRRHGYAWTQFIIWGSFAGGLMCLTGLAVGIWRLSPRARFRQKHQASHSPYAGLMRWHHYAGLLFGLVTFTWIISGAFSVNPFNMFSGGGGITGRDREVLTGGPFTMEPLTVEALRAGAAVIGAHFAAKEIEVRQFRGRHYMTANRPPGPEDPEVPSGPVEHRMVWMDAPDEGSFQAFAHDAIDQIADAIKVNVPVEDRMWLHAYDNYYRSRDGSRPLPVLRIRYLDEDRTWVYIDPARGSMTAQGRGARMNRWLYAALHEFDFPYLYERRPLWDIVVIGLSLGGIVLSGSTLWPTVKRLRRHARRLVAWLRRPRTRVLTAAPAPPAVPRWPRGGSNRPRTFS